MNKIIAVAVSAALLAACSPSTPQTMQVDRTNNPQINVEYMFTHDGVNMYRFYDGYRNVYFTAPSGATQWNESCGKGCTRQQRVEGRAPKTQAGVRP